MAQIFYLKQGSVLPTLRIELINDGRYDFIKGSKFNNAIQNADVTFSMLDENGILKISNAPCSIVLSAEGGCEERYIIEYRWKKRDTKSKGQFTGQFKINFFGNIKESSTERKAKTSDCGEDATVTESGYLPGELLVPIYEDLKIFIL